MRLKSIRAIISTFLFTAIIPHAPIAIAAGSKAMASGSGHVPQREEVINTIRRAAIGEVERLKGIDSNPARGRWGANSNWISATYFVGAMKLLEVEDVPEVREYAFNHARRYNYALQGHGAPVHLLNADDQAIGDLYQAIYLQTGAPGVLLPLRQRLDYTVPYLGLETDSDKLIWWWCDALFMAPPVLARMSAITGDDKYIYAMDAQWWKTYDRLYDKEQHLYARDARFIERRSANGKQIFWSRGEGWVMAGIARVLEVMPADFPTRHRYEALYREMAAKVITLQHEDGLWRASLLDPEAFPEPETSGTAFFTYALAFGINHGLLDREVYLPHVLKGWAGLNRYVLPSGIPGQVQSAGDQPVPTKPETTALYASGAFIMAGLEVANLGRPVQSLPIQLPTPPKQVYHASDIPEYRLASDATPDQIREHNRREAERQAVKDLAFDPLVDDPNFVPPISAPSNNGQATRLTPPAEPDQKPRAVVRFAPDRSDDILWENDRVAHRIYGPALQKIEFPSGSGIDAWAKKVRWPYMDRLLKNGDYHRDYGEGLDYYNVKASRGVGGLGVWQNNKLWVSRNWVDYKILQNGPEVASFEVRYDPWPVGVERKVWESRTFSLPLGTNFTRMQSKIDSDKPETLIIGVGLGKGATAPGKGHLIADKERGLLAYWEPADLSRGTMGTVVRVDPSMVEDITADVDNHLILIRVKPGTPFVYYIGSTWDRGLDFNSRKDWEQYITNEKLDFTVK